MVAVVLAKSCSSIKDCRLTSDVAGSGRSCVFVQVTVYFVCMFQPYPNVTLYPTFIDAIFSVGRLTITKKFKKNVDVNLPIFYMSHAVDKCIHNRVYSIKFIIKENVPNAKPRMITKPF